ncbi:hypothetical protein EOL94_03465 [bacterium]|nr:hypothetical protein [bacterium]
MENYIYNKGSEWQKSDLHIHTPFTAENDNFAGANDNEKWENFIKKVEESGDVGVLGITDYYSVENYKKVKEFKDGGNLSNVHFLIPNVELRMIPSTEDGKAINIHCLFNPEIINDLNDRFFSKLEFHYDSRDFSATKESLISLGKKYKKDENLNDVVARKEGVEQFKISFNNLSSIFKKDLNLRKNTIIAVSNSNRDGNSSIQHSGLAATREEIYRFTDIIFSSNPNDRIYFLGDGVDNKETIKAKYGSLKSCLHGSDAHRIVDVLHPCAKRSDGGHNCESSTDCELRYCWIKANPTFNGLKQVIYEPKERVKIQEEVPELKNSYQLIDKVKFIDSEFTSEYINFNQNLNVIIGGRSTGKSLLLKSIAKSVDPVEVENRYKQVAFQKQGKDVSDFEVIWKDGQIDNLSSADKTGKKIIYIPQSYLNRLVDNDERSAIDLIIEDLINQDEDNKKILSDLKYLSEQNEQKINYAINELFVLEENIILKSDEIKEYGDEKGVINEIGSLEKEIADLKVKAGMTETEILLYNNLNQEINKKNKEKNEILEKNRLLVSFSKVNLFSEIDYSILPEEYVDLIRESVNLLQQQHSEKFKNEIKKYFSENLEKIKVINEDLTAKELELNPLKEKAIKNNILKSKLETLTAEKIKLDNIAKGKSQLNALREKYKKSFPSIMELNKKYFYEHENARGAILKKNILSGDLKLDVGVSILKKEFEKILQDLFDQRTTKKIEEIDFTHPNFFKNLEEIVLIVLNGDKDLRLRSQFNKKEALYKLLKNWFYLDFTIEYEGDKLNDQEEPMSPGKKALVLLKLLIELDKSECPILLDQPEDDLDNRSIYNSLSRFIREKKVQRQIIIVSHNPNIVVGADSENVIVANQEDKDKNSLNKNKTYTFEYVSGALENSFTDNAAVGILYQKGVREHVCEILEGGEEAFEKRELKYNFK